MNKFLITSLFICGCSQSASAIPSEDSGLHPDVVADASVVVDVGMDTKNDTSLDVTDSSFKEVSVDAGVWTVVDSGRDSGFDAGPECFGKGAVYQERFVELPFGTCNLLLPENHSFQGDGGNILLSGSQCAEAGVSGCTLTNNGCVIRGSGFICNLEGSVTMQPDGGFGSGIENVVCRQQFCNPQSICTDETILGDQTMCSSSFTILMIHQ
jgi:hypothetical protein